MRMHVLAVKRPRNERLFTIPEGGDMPWPEAYFRLSLAWCDGVKDVIIRRKLNMGNGLTATTSAVITLDHVITGMGHQSAVNGPTVYVRK